MQSTLSKRKQVDFHITQYEVNQHDLRPHSRRITHINSVPDGVVLYNVVSDGFVLYNVVSDSSVRCVAVLNGILRHNEVSDDMWLIAVSGVVQRKVSLDV